MNEEEIEECQNIGDHFFWGAVLLVTFIAAVAISHWVTVFIAIISYHVVVKCGRGVLWFFMWREREKVEDA